MPYHRVRLREGRPCWCRAVNSWRGHRVRLRSARVCSQVRPTSATVRDCIGVRQAGEVTLPTEPDTYPIPIRLTRDSVLAHEQPWRSLPSTGSVSRLRLELGGGASQTSRGGVPDETAAHSSRPASVRGGHSDWARIDKGNTALRLQLPRAHCVVVGHKTLELPAAKRFLDYAEANGAFRMASPSKELWRWQVWSDAVASPLTRALNSSMFLQLCDAGKALPWVVEPLGLREFVQRSIQSEESTSSGLTWVDAACLLTGHLDAPVEMSQEVTLSPLSDLQHRAFSSQYRQSLSRYFPSLPEVSILATVVGGFRSPQKWGGSDRLRTASLQIDLLKLALAVRSSQQTILTEGSLLLFSAGGVVADELDRQASRSSHPCPTLTDVESARELFAMIRRATESCPDIEAAIYLFGRATTAPFAREQVFEAVAGLERLLSPGTNPSYAVPLHAAILLADSLPERETVFKTVKKFYGMRSTAAHGGLPQVPDDALVPAVWLARSIARYCELAAVGGCRPRSRRGNQTANVRVCRARRDVATARVKLGRYQASRSVYSHLGEYRG